MTIQISLLLDNGAVYNVDSTPSPKGARDMLKQAILLKQEAEQLQRQYTEYSCECENLINSIL